MASPENRCETFPSVQSDLSLASAPYRIDFNVEKFGQSLRNAGASDEQVSSLSVILTRKPEEKPLNLLPNFASYNRDTNTIDIYGDNIWVYKPQGRQSEDLAHEARHTLQTEKMKRIDTYVRAFSLIIPTGVETLILAYAGYELGDGMLKIVGAVGGAIEGLVVAGVGIKSMASMGLVNYTSPLEHGARRYAKRHKEEYSGIISIQERKR